MWDGVSNNFALKHLRTIKAGDLAFIYHTGKERALVGIAEVISDPYPDSDKKRSKTRRDGRKGQRRTSQEHLPG